MTDQNLAEDFSQWTPEQIILWLEGYRELMFEIWRSNPELRAEWERLNLDY